MNKGKLMTILSVAVVAAMLLASISVLPIKTEANSSTLSLKGTELSVGAVPGAPRNLVADHGPGFVWLWWDHPATNGDQLIKTYQIFRGTSSGGETLLDTIFVGATYYDDPLTFESLWLSGLNFYNDTTAAVGSTYYYEIRAVSDAGNSSFSNEASATPSFTGDAPNAPSASGTGMAYSAQLNWTTATVAGGSPPTRFFYLYREGYFLPFPITASFGEGGYLDEAGFFGPVVGHSYNYTVRAANTYGQGQDTVMDLFIGGTGDTPSEPLNLTALGLNNSVYLFWDPPLNPSAHGFERYDIVRSTSEAGPFALIGNVSTGGIFGYTGLYFDNAVVNGVQYFYAVKASYETGSGPFSNIVNATPEGFTFPFEVNFLDAYPGNNKILLDWSGAFNATGYQIWRGGTSNGETLLTTVSTETTYFDNTAINGNTYYYKVKPVHLSTIGNFSPEASAAASTGNPPDAPELFCTPSSGGVALYSPPVSVTSPIIRWDVFRGDSSGTESPVSIYNETGISFTTSFEWADPTSLPDQNYYYYVTAENMFAASAHSNEASSFMSPTGDVPEPVGGIAANSGLDGITLTWDSPTYEGTAILLFYELQRNDSVGGWDTLFGSIADVKGTTQYTDHFVIGGVTYHYRVLASNLYGDSSGFSPTASETAVSPGTLPSAPQNLIVNAGVGYVLLTWSNPADFGTPNFVFFDVYRSTTSGVFGAPIAELDASILAYNDTSVTGGTPYFYVVKAVSTVGSSPASNEVTGTPTAVPSVPGAPSGLEASPGAGFVLLNWTAPSDIGSPGFTRYDIYRGTSSGVYGSPIQNVAAGTLVFNDTTVIAGTPYYYVVKAVNTVGSSPASNEATATATPGPQAPSAPRNLTAIIGDGYVLLSWEAPTNLGNPEFTQYDIYRGSTLGSIAYLANVTAGNLTYNDTSVVNGETYLYVVKAANSIGSSPASNAPTAIPGRVPSAPIDLEASPGAGFILLNWTLPSDLGDPNLTGYDVYRGTGPGVYGNPIANVAAGTLVFNDTTVIAGTPYYYVVKSVNAVGSSPASNEATATATPGPQAPSAPQDLAAVSGDNFVQLSWSAPLNLGNPELTRYDVFRGATLTSVAYLANVTAGTLSFNDTTAVNGNTYVYVVEAVNAIGSSPASNTAQATPSQPGIAPGAPQNLDAVGHVGSIVLTWEAPSNVGSGVTNYKIFRATTSNGQDSAPLATISGGLLTYNDSSAIVGTPYFYKVKASNSFGDSGFSNEDSATATEQPSTTPSSPQNLAATPGDGKVTLTWQAPANDGGSPITGYNVYRQEGSATPVLLDTVSATTLSYVDTTGAAGTTYKYFVIATNANGAGSQSSEVNASPEPPSDNGGGMDTITWIIIAVVAILAIVLVAYFLMRSKP